MYKIVICDDDTNFIDYIEKKLYNCGLSKRDTEIYHASSGEECIDLVKHMSKCDLLILDMQMPGMDGHETAKLFRDYFKDSLLVLCSGVVQPTDESFKVTPYRYLKKSYSDEKMLEELKDVTAKMIELKSIPYIIGKNHNNIVKLQPSDILFIENYKRGSALYVHQEMKNYSFEDKITTDKKLKELYDELKEYDFEFAHNSYIVNMRYVIKLKSEGIIKLIDGTELNVSRSKMPNFRKELTRVMSSKYL